MRQQMKKTLTITLVAAAVIAAALLFPWNLDVRNRDNLANRIQCILCDKNKVIVKGMTDSVEIRLLGYDKRTIFSNGKKRGRIPRDYGDICFKLYCRNQPFGEACIFNTNWWQTHDFIFDLTQGIRNFTFSAQGPDAASAMYVRIQYDSTAEIRTCYDLSGAITCRDTVFPE